MLILKKISSALKFVLFCLAFSAMTANPVFSQDFNSMNSSDMSDFEQKALQQGISPEQIEMYKQRMGQKNASQQFATPSSKIIRTGNYTTDTTMMFAFDSTKSFKDSLFKTDSTKQIDSTKRADSIITLPYFGYDIFKKLPDAFKPNAVGPVDPGYLVGPGDVLRLTVWGQVELQYELTVDNEGKVFIPVIGQVYVTGTPFEELQEKIKKLLSRSYSGLSSTPQRTFMDLTVAQLRPVRVFIMGEINNPGGYTVSSFATTFNALYSVGGPLERGSLRNIKVIRGGKEIAVVDFYEYLLAGKCTTDVRLQNNDVVFVPPREKTVAISGSVFRPAIYEMKQTDNLKSLLSFCGGVLTGTNVDRAQVFRVLPFKERDNINSTKRVQDIKLSDYLNGSADFQLFDKDSVAVIPLSSDLKNFVQLSGAVRYPGYYQSDSLSLRKLVLDYGQPVEEKAYLRRADIVRLNKDLVTHTTIPINLDKLYNEKSYDVELQPKDEVIIYNKNVVKQTDLQVTIDGEVQAPGKYNLSVNLTVADALIRAGGFTRKAYKKSVDVCRPYITRGDTLTKVFKIDLPDSLDYSDDRGREFTLEDRDRIVVRPDPDYREENIIKIEGLIKYAGTYALEKRSEHILEVIEKAGGLQPDAYLEGSNVTRHGKRLVVNMAEAYHNKRSKENIILQKGDSIYIPPVPNSVLVHGRVNNEGLYSYIQKSRAYDYIDRAGGLSDSAGYVVVIFPNGESKKLSSRALHKNPVILDGSEIFVTTKRFKTPEEKKGPTIAEVIRDTLAIVTSAVTVIALAVQMKK